MVEKQGYENNGHKIVWIKILMILRENLNGNRISADAGNLVLTKHVLIGEIVSPTSTKVPITNQEVTSILIPTVSFTQIICNPALDITWVGNFNGGGRENILIYCPNDDNWLLGSIDINGKLNRGIVTQLAPKKHM